MSKCERCGKGSETTDCECEEWMNAPMGKLKEINSLEIRVIFLEEELDKLTDIVKKMSDYLIQVSDSSKVFKKVED